MKNYVFICLFIMASNLVVTQEAVLCSLQTDTFGIENSANIPLIISNGDDTITLTFPDQYVTDIFANYTIYDFYQAYPNTSGTLEKYYNISYGSRALIEDVITNVPIDIMEYSGPNINAISLPFKTSISPNLIQALDGKTYDVTKYRSTSDADDCYGNCPLYNVPNDFNFRVNFNYNTETELLTMESESLTSCGNEFSIALTGGNPNGFTDVSNTLQFWEVTPGTSAISEFSQICHYIESTVFAVLNIACTPYQYAIGNISVTLNSENESIRFERSNMVFGYDTIEFSEANLSVEDQSFQLMKPFEKEDSPYLQIAHLNNQSVSIEVYNTSGQHLLQIKKFEENRLNISNLSSGLYFIRISNLNNLQKIFKFLKN